jgi:hypothetical protein
MLIRALPVALAGVIASTGAAGDPSLAVVRSDGALQPLARIAAGAWQPLAPADAAGAWNLWLFDDPAVKVSPFAPRTARAITTGAGAACLPVSGLDASALGPAGPTPGAAARPSSTPAVAVVGLALSGTDVRPDLPVAVAPDTDLARQLTVRAAAAFHRADDDTLTLEAEELPAGFPRFAERRQRPITWTRIARQGTAQAAARAYYLEGWKDYPGFRGRTDIGQIRTTGHVFMQLNGERETIDAEVDLSDLAGHQSMFRTPLAVVAWPARAAWLFATRGPDGAHLEIIELTPGTGRPRSVWQGPDGCERGTP